MIECSANAIGIGKPHKTMGESIETFIIQNQDKTKSLALFQPTQNQVMKDSGKIGVPPELDTAPPKTQAEKIMRRVLKATEPGSTKGPF